MLSKRIPQSFVTVLIPPWSLSTFTSLWSFIVSCTQIMFIKPLSFIFNYLLCVCVFIFKHRLIVDTLSLLGLLRRCMDSRLKTLENSDKSMFFKNLSKVFQLKDSLLQSSNTISIDDEPYKAILNPVNLYKNIY